MTSTNIEIAHGITLIDTQLMGRPGLAASYLLQSSGKAAFVETGSTHSTALLLAAAKERGIKPADVEFVIVTHIHLDHAAGAGSLLEALPNARLVVHPRGARHMIDPTKLIAAATAVYGEPFVQRSYGRLVAISAERVLEASDGLELEVGGRRLRVLETPGHARHHICLWDAATRGFFTGDVLGLAYGQLHTATGPFVFPSTSPARFEPEAMHASIDRLMAEDPQCAYLTHFGKLEHLSEHAAELHQLIDAFVEVATVPGITHDQIARSIMSTLLRRLASKGSTIEESDARTVLAMDVELNTQGLEIWREKSNAT